MTEPTTTFALTEMGGEPRVRDLDVAERLGFKRPRVIRELIERNLAEFEALGPSAVQYGAYRGQATREYWLNEEQALLAAVLSNAEKAPTVRRMLIQTFTAHRRGQLAGGLTAEQAELLRRADGICRMLSHKFTEMEKTIDQIVGDRIEAAVTARLATDPRSVVVTDFKPMIDILKEAGVVHAKGRGALSRRCSNMALKFYAVHKQQTRTSPETKRWLFHVDGVELWLAMEGRSVIAQHIERQRGQGDLFRPRVVK